MSETQVTLTIAQAASILKAVIGEKTAAYVSVPITTGRRFLEWYKNVGQYISGEEYSLRHFNDVILENIAYAKGYIEMVREKSSGLVVDPISLNIDTWSQNIYNDFWERVIDLFIDKVFLLDGWHYSRGCVIEFLACQRKGIKVYNQKSDILTISDGISLIRRAIVDYKELGLDVSFQEKVYKELCSIA